MAYCSKCKRDYPENMKFCHECGSPLEIKSSEEENAGAEAASVSAEVKRAKNEAELRIFSQSFRSVFRTEKALSLITLTKCLPMS